MSEWQIREVWQHCLNSSKFKDTLYTLDLKVKYYKVRQNMHNNCNLYINEWEKKTWLVEWTRIYFQTLCENSGRLYSSMCSREPTSGWEDLFSKLVEGRRWIRSQLALVNLTIRSLRKYRLKSHRKATTRRHPTTTWPISLT